MHNFHIRSRSLLTALLLTLLFAGCGGNKKVILKTPQGDEQPIAHIDCCDDFTQEILELDPTKEVFILVHGCRGSTGSFTTLRKVFESRGQQAICFGYDYRDKIEHCAADLLSAINRINHLVDPPRITVIGHSQGGLVSRRALISEREEQSLKTDKQNIRLVTISAPFNGIYASEHCGIPALHVLSAGLTVLICKGITGRTWTEINPRSDFINNPGTVVDNVIDHLKIVTDESETCRRFNEEGECIESDFIFSLEEQYHPLVDTDKRVTNVEIKAGHALVVGQYGQPPLELIDVLQNNNILKPDLVSTPAERNELLISLYKQQ